ncbi:MAG: pyruvate carboxylase [Sandaracinus sp.]
MTATPSSSAPRKRPIQKILCANRGEIAIRVFRAATELGLSTVAIYSHEDRVHLHRYKADEAYLVGALPGGKRKNAVAAYLGVEEIIEIAKAANVDAIHPGYGFLAENAGLAKACDEAGIAFVGPSADVLRRFGDKTSARSLAKEVGIPTVPGTDGPVATIDEARAFVEKAGLPVIIKAAMGGGGRGMRVVREASELAEAFDRCRSEALAAFGDGTVFLERYVDRPRHIEVQILADAAGEVMHLFERDCSVQRRHQKVVEMAPAQALDPDVRAALCADAVKLCAAAGYRNAGTVEFLVDGGGRKGARHYFIEVNPRIQVEHTVTEEVTGVDLVQSQIRIAGGATFAELGLVPGAVQVRGVAVQCRVTTEDPRKNFQPDTGRIEAFRAGEGMGIRLDAGSGYAGAQIAPDYDSLLVKVTARALTFEDAIHKLHRALAEFRVRGVSTNIPFLQNVLRHPDFAQANTYTAWVDATRELFELPNRKNRAQRILRYLADLAVNGPEQVGMTASGPMPAKIEPTPPVIPPTYASLKSPPPQGFRDVLVNLGPAAFAKAVRQHRGLLVTDTTWRDAHQSLLATRVRTLDLEKIAPHTARLMPSLYSLECWGGATFDVALRFLHECPWDRLERLRALVPNVPFQMLFRGANAVGYTSYPDNVVYAFAKMAKDKGVDVFRIFDSLNYVENLKLGIDAVGQAGGVIEAAICYTGDVSDAGRTKYSLQYYVDLAGQLAKLGIHVLAVKDMAGLLKPRAATMLIGALRRAFPELPIHVHTHDTAGTGVASMLACAEADADAVDLALPAMAGLTSQPTMSAVVTALRGTARDTSIDPDAIRLLNGYWEEARALYAPFETGMTGYAPDLHEHEMPGGQYTNLLFQAQQNGLGDRWSAIKRSYREANLVLGDIIKVTPSSKTVGDLAQFMVQNDLDAKSVVEKADTLSFPSSVVEFFEGRLGQPHGGFPEPLRTRVLRGKKPMQGRPGTELAPLDLEKLKKDLEAEHPGIWIRDHDIMSAAMYPDVFRDYRNFRTERGDVSRLPTRQFLVGLAKGEELMFDIERGKTLVVTLRAIGELDEEGNRRVFFDLNGQPRAITVADKKAKTSVKQRERANVGDPGSIGAPMPGTVVDVRVKQGASVKKGEPLCVLSAMKMETVVASPIDGTVQRVAVAKSDVLKAGDLLVEMTLAS